MGQPFPGVWLPRGMNIHAGLTLAVGSFEASYGRTFTNYREADVKTKITVPKLSSHFDSRDWGARSVPVRDPRSVVRDPPSNPGFVASGFSRKIGGVRE